jgi:hypothetical protein
MWAWSSASTTGTADTQTQASWRVGNLGAELAQLRSRGVEVLEYDTPGLKTENGAADVGSPGPHGLRIRVAMCCPSSSTSESGQAAHVLSSSAEIPGGAAA